MRRAPDTIVHVGAPVFIDDACDAAPVGKTMFSYNAGKHGPTLRLQVLQPLQREVTEVPAFEVMETVTLQVVPVDAGWHRYGFQCPGGLDALRKLPAQIDLFD